MLVLHGEEAHNETFHDVVRDALHDIQGPGVLQVVLSPSSGPIPWSTEQDPLLSWRKELLSSANARRKRRGAVRNLRAVGNDDGAFGGRIAR